MGFEQYGYAKSYVLDLHVLNLQLQKHHKETFDNFKNKFLSDQFNLGYKMAKVYKTTAKGTKIKFEITKEKEEYFKELRKMKKDAEIISKKTKKRIQSEGE